MTYVILYHNMPQARLSIDDEADQKLRLWLVDGLHRLKAHELNKVDHVQAWVNKDVTDFRSLYVEAVRLNAKHGRALTRRDKEGIVKKLQELKVEEAEITRLILAPISRFKPVNYSNFRKSVGVRKPWHGRRTNRPDQRDSGTQALFVNALLDVLRTANRCLREIDFGEVDNSRLSVLKQEIEGIFSAFKQTQVFAGASNAINQSFPAERIGDADVIKVLSKGNLVKKGSNCEFVGSDTDDNDLCFSDETGRERKVCSVCGSADVYGDGFICEMCERSFPKIE